ncbi:hypothetical protein Bca52824_033247 [Brassica carinata]|uniref:Uncharacterized protein n=1 Tax=Brassica carinata TaxID=52824 RepID=A0A8X7V9A0_BRACI|nr:hypothetical protein Bca52824_033247 [Brassica carinata]
MILWVTRTPLDLGTLFGGIYRSSSRFVFNSGGISIVNGSAANKGVLLEKTKGKRLKLPLMGTFSNVYPDYAKILAAQLGDTSFGSAANAGEKNSAVVDALVDQGPEPASVAARPNNGGPVDAPPSKKKRKRVRSSSKTRTDPSLGGDERDVARSPRGSRGDDEMEGDREGSRAVSSESPTRDLSSGGGVLDSSGTARQTVSRTLTTIEISGLSFTDQLSALACAEAEVATCKDNLVAGYEAALRKATFDLEKVKEEIRSKEAELKVIKREKLDGAKELEAARSRIVQLEEEKVEDSEKTKRAMERMRQSRNRKLLSERKCVVAAAERHFEKFRKYMADRDRKEEKRLLHGTALGTLDAVTMLETIGLPVPRELTDLLTTNEETFRNEAEEITVEVSTVVRLPTTALGGDLAGALDRPFGTVSGGGWDHGNRRCFFVGSVD